METKEQQTICTSVFKYGCTISKDQFTRKWIELINRLEKDKTIVFQSHT